MAFTTWTALKTQLLDELASGAWKTKSYTIGNRQMQYRSFEEFKAFFDFVSTKADEETAGTVISRVYAKQGGRG